MDKAGQMIRKAGSTMISLRSIFSSNVVRTFATGAVLAAAPVASHAGIFISVGIAPPPLPVYTQPICPTEGYLWTPGYWNYGPAGYYWVPGVWVQPPSVGLLWTPGYWGFGGGQYRWNAGYWGPHVGFYGGVNYGFGYGGNGFEGGYWGGGHYFYNRSVTNINVTNIHNVYERNVTVVNNNYSRTSFNGGNGGIQARPTVEQQQFSHEQHIGPTANQVAFRTQAENAPGQRFSQNHGNPATVAAQTHRDGFGRGNEVNARQGNQQQRINNGVQNGQMTPGEARNVERRDASISNQARQDRQANGGNLTNDQRQQINQRQNNVSRSIYNDNHNANNDAAAAARNNRTPQQEQNRAGRQEQRNAPAPGPRAGGEHGGGERGGGERGGGRPR